MIVLCVNIPHPLVPLLVLALAMVSGQKNVCTKFPSYNLAPLTHNPFLGIQSSPGVTLFTHRKLRLDYISFYKLEKLKTKQVENFFRVDKLLQDHRAVIPLAIDKDTSGIFLKFLFWAWKLCKIAVLIFKTFPSKKTNDSSKAWQNVLLHVSSERTLDGKLIQQISKVEKDISNFNQSKYH